MIFPDLESQEDFSVQLNSQEIKEKKKKPTFNDGFTDVTLDVFILTRLKSQNPELIYKFRASEGTKGRSCSSFKYSPKKPTKNSKETLSPQQIPFSLVCRN